MASRLLSRLSRFKGAAFSLPRTRIFANFRPSNDVNYFVSPGWATATRKFCDKPNGDDESRAKKSCDSEKARKGDKAKGNAKGSARRLLAALNLEHVMNITAFPTDFLESDECLFDLFELWLEQMENKTYHSEQEKMHRFKIFKDMVFRVNELNKIPKSYKHGLTCFADLTPEEIISRGYISVNFATYAGGLFTG